MKVSPENPSQTYVELNENFLPSLLLGTCIIPLIAVSTISTINIGKL